MNRPGYAINGPNDENIVLTHHYLHTYQADNIDEFQRIF